MTEASNAVFLSYASQDNKAAQRICEALRAAGIEVWFDQSELRGGDAWDQKIRGQIRTCALLIPLISANTVARREGYFRLEWDLADQRTHMMARDRVFVVPVCLDRTPETGADVPESFQRVQWTRLPGGETPAAFVQRIKRLLSSEQAPASVAGASAVSEPLRQDPIQAAGSRRRAVLILAAAAAIAAAAFLVIERPWSPRAPAPALMSHVDPKGSPESTKKSIAVLPFTDLSEKHDQEYFADGLAEEILDLLAKIPSLSVIGRTSSFQFKGKSADLRAIGAALGASYVLEGSVRRSDARLKVNVQLIDARDGTHRWSETYERAAGDAMLLQRQIASAVARALEVSVADYFGPGGDTKSPEAHDFYLRGLRDVDFGGQDSELRAVAEMSRAVEIDPQYVNAWVGLADAYDSAATDRVAPAAETYRLALSAVNKALALDPGNAEAYAMRAFIDMNTWNWTQADEDIRKSISIRPTNSALQASAKLATARGDLPKAEQLLRDTLALDPLDTYALFDLAYWVYPGLGRFEDAERVDAKLRDVAPDLAYLNYNAAIIAVLRGEDERALKLAQLETDPAGRQSALAMVYGAMHRPNESKQALDRLLQMPQQDYLVAEVYAYMRQTASAFQYLERAYEGHSPDLLGLKADPLFAGLRGDPRYAALVHKLNLSH